MYCRCLKSIDRRQNNFLERHSPPAQKLRVSVCLVCSDKAVVSINHTEILQALVDHPTIQPGIDVLCGNRHHPHQRSCQLQKQQQRRTPTSTVPVHLPQSSLFCFLLSLSFLMPHLPSFTLPYNISNPLLGVSILVCTAIAYTVAKMFGFTRKNEFPVEGRVCSTPNWLVLIRRPCC